jgi:hypothetical protein
MQNVQFIVCDSDFTEINISCQNPMHYSELEPSYVSVLSASERDSANSSYPEVRISAIVIKYSNFRHVIFALCI